MLRSKTSEFFKSSAPTVIDEAKKHIELFTTLTKIRDSFPENKDRTHSLRKYHLDPIMDAILSVLKKLSADKHATFPKAKVSSQIFVNVKEDVINIQNMVAKNIEDFIAILTEKQEMINKTRNSAEIARYQGVITRCQYFIGKLNGINADLDALNIFPTAKVDADFEHPGRVSRVGPESKLFR